MELGERVDEGGRENHGKHEEGEGMGMAQMGNMSVE
jgi:hypothetical protein